MSHLTLATSSPDFELVNHNRSHMPNTPTCLRISPNGRFMAVNNSERVYLFDLNRPDQGWQEGHTPMDAEIVVPTDRGNYWIQHARSVSLVGREGDKLLNFSVPQFLSRCIWGNDGWLLQHDTDELCFADMSDRSIHRQPHHHTILHAWMHNHRLRLLSVSEKKQWLYLHEWDIAGAQMRLVQKKRGKVSVGIEGIDADYMFTSCVHAWPGEAQSVRVHLVAGTVDISAEGEITPDPHASDWSPIIHSSAPMTPLMLARATAYALDAGFTTTAGFGATPYLITTLQRDDKIHVITTLWHKSIAVEDYKRLDEAVIAERIKSNSNICKLILCACSDEIPVHDAFLALVLSELEEQRDWQHAPAYIKRLKEPILTLFEALMPSLLERESDESTSAYVTPYKMHALLHHFAFFPGMIPLFFDCLQQGALPEDACACLLQRTRIIIPLLPPGIRQQIPDSILQQQIALPETLLHPPADFTEDDLEFLINRAPARLFSPRRIITLLTQYHRQPVLLSAIFKRMEGSIERIRQCPTRQRDQIAALLVNIFEQGADQALLMIWKLDASFFENQPVLQSGILPLIQRDTPQLQEIVTFLSERAPTGDDPEAEYIAEILNMAAHDYLIPSFIHTMAELNRASSKPALTGILVETEIEFDRHDPRQLVEALWSLGCRLQPDYRKHYATTLLAALNRCIQDHINDTNFTLSPQPAITAEAALLGKLNEANNQPVMEEILASSRTVV